MELTLNISKKGLNTSAEVINEEYTLNYGHVFRGLTAYEQAVKGGFQGSKEEFEAYVGGIGKVSEDAKTAANIANIAATNADSATQNANAATARANASASRAAAAATEAMDATERVEGKIIEANGATQEAIAATEEARDAIANFEGKYDDFVLKEQGKGLSTNNYTDADKALVQSIPTLNKNVAKNTADIKTKQETLSLATKPNGNIVIGNIAGQSKEFMPATPSGDTLHYMYLSAYPELAYNATTDRWSYCADKGGLTDITTEEVRKIFALSGSGLNNNNWDSRFYEARDIRTNFIKRPTPPDWGYLTNSAIYTFLYCTNLEVAVVSTSDYIPNKCQGMFFSCTKLRKIIGDINLYYANNTSTDMFKKCAELADVRLVRLRGNISLSDSPLLSYDSLKYMIENCASDANIVITVHPDIWDKIYYEGNWGELDTYANEQYESKNTYIEIASA